MITFLNLIASLIILYFVYRIFKSLFYAFYPFFTALKIDLHKLAGANWAVVTGATDGIGKAYALELAKKGFDIVLISRTQSRLEATKDEIQKINPIVKVEVIVFDFCQADINAYNTTIFDILKTIDIGVLVNNVGMAYDYPDILHEVHGGIKSIRDVIIINTLPMTILTCFALEQMSKRQKGVIINISSAAAWTPMTYWATYSATKQYVNHFSEAIRKEYAGQGITIQTICPMVVATKMSKIEQSLIFVNPTKFVKQALRSVGHVAETTGCFIHQLQSWAFALPSFVLNLMAKNANRKLKTYLKNVESKYEIKE